MLSWALSLLLSNAQLGASSGHYGYLPLFLWDTGWSIIPYLQPLLCFQICFSHWDASRTFIDIVWGAAPLAVPFQRFFSNYSQTPNWTGMWGWFWTSRLWMPFFILKTRSVIVALYPSEFWYRWISRMPTCSFWFFHSMSAFCILYWGFRVFSLWLISWDCPSFHETSQRCVALVLDLLHT